MATKGDENNDLLTCSICFEQFDSPKCLPCQHTFCRQCLKSYIVTKLGGVDQKSKPFPCPFCRQLVPVSDPNITSDNIADILPGNHLIMSLIERSKRAEPLVETNSLQLCEPCHIVNQEVEATTWCTFCTEALCGKCTSIHKQLKKKVHTLVPIEEMAKKRAELFEQEEPCLKHSGKSYEVYCVDHKEMCCVICLATQHRKCEHISTFEEMIQSPENANYFENFKSCLKDIDEKASGLVTETEENINLLENRHGEISEQVSSTIQQTHKLLDNLYTTFQTNFTQMHKMENIKLEDRKERVAVFLDNVRKSRKLLDIVHKQGTAKQLFITQEKLKAQLMDQKKRLKEDMKDVQSIDYTLKMNEIKIPLGTGSAIPILAEIDLKSTSNTSETLNEVFDKVDSLSGIVAYVDVDKIEVSEVVSVFGNTNNIFLGGTYLPNGRIIFCNYTQKKLLACDNNGNVLFESPIQDKAPHDACCMSASLIAVSFYSSNYIKKFEVTQNVFNETMTIKCKNHPEGLALTQNSLVVGFSDRIDVLSTDGQFIKTLSSRKKDGLSYVTVSPSGNVYYSDGDYVMCKTLDEKEVKRFTYPQLKCLSGIGLDKFENIYVCGNDSHNVCVFSRDGNKRRVLIQDIGHPFKIGFDLKGTKFFVASGGERKVFSCCFG